MATWISLKRACKYPEVERVYKRAGRGQGTAQAAPTYVLGTLQSAPKGFFRTVMNFVQGSNAGNGLGPNLPAWIRLRTATLGTTQSIPNWQNVQVDVTAIPGVRPLRDSGKWTKSDQQS